MLKKIIAIPDIQAPDHDEEAVKTAVKIVAGEKPDILIFIGDFVDLSPVSKYKKKKWREYYRTVAGDFAAGNKILDNFDKVTPPETIKIYMEGNHEERLEAFFVDKTPELGSDFKGITVREQLNLDRRNIKYITRREQPVMFGRVGFMHGRFVNKHHAMTTVQKYNQSIIYGHKHDLQTFTGFHISDEGPRMAMSIGCLCKFQQDYMDNSPMNWIHGIAIIYIDRNSGRFWPYFCPIIAGEAVINGKRYKS